ncbi:hypothetical protein DERF_014834 [Dermatophagoides farinae]|uniref:Uncharacterized protein n=1 Tax=Dermatophagoides farinae TaxID=6954 RepID=A0A922HNP7_DERFA|nr:hypothetical protein DERF_014834 [Dermatophagoides farinae]
MVITYGSHGIFCLDELNKKTKLDSASYITIINKCLLAMVTCVEQSIVIVVDFRGQYVHRIHHSMMIMIQPRYNDFRCDPIQKDLLIP